MNECLSLNEMNYLYMIESCNNDHMLFEFMSMTDIMGYINEAVDLKTSFKKFINFIIEKWTKLIDFFKEMINKIKEDVQIKQMFIKAKPAMKTIEEKNVIMKTDAYKIKKNTMDDFIRGFKDSTDNKTIILIRKIESSLINRLIAGTKTANRVSKTTENSLGELITQRKYLIEHKYASVFSSFNNYFKVLNGVGSQDNAVKIIKENTFEHEEIEIGGNFNIKDLSEMEKDHKFIISKLDELKKQSDLTQKICDGEKKLAIKLVNKLGGELATEQNIQYINAYFAVAIQFINYYRDVCMVAITSLKYGEMNIKKVLIKILGDKTLKEES